MLDKDYTCDMCGFESQYSDDFYYFPEGRFYQCMTCMDLDDREARLQRTELSEVTDFHGFFWEENF